MSQDLKYIKNILKKCEEVDSPFEIKKGDIVRYITIQNGSEFFYTGGKYLNMYDNKISVKCDDGVKKVPITILNSNGDILYKTRFFVECGEKCQEKTKNEYEKIIKNQQRIIDVLIKKNKELEETINNSS